MAEPSGHGIDLGALETRLASVDIAADPDEWAISAYRLGVARSELLVDRSEIPDIVGLLQKAGRILTAERAPLEHGRILTAIGNCERVAGRPDLAVATFQRSAQLLAGRANRVEQGAALANVGLALTETGDGVGAIAALDDAVDLLRPEPETETDDQRPRTLGAALLNRAQAKQALGDDDHLASAVADYHAAATTLSPESPQAGMAWHGHATALLEQARRQGSAIALIDQAIQAVDRSIAVFTYDGFPFQHAIARHSLSVAHHLRADHRSSSDPTGSENARLDLALAAHHGEMALGLFDPRLHSVQWRTVKATLDEIEGAVAPQNLSQVLVDLLGSVDEQRRVAVLRDRLVRLGSWPEVAVAANFDRLGAALAERDTEHYRTVAQSLISVLMELPDAILEVACRSLVNANKLSVNPESANRALDDAIQARLFGPQRVRVRDLLELHGWERP